MGKLKITVDLECGRCSTKIQKVLCCIQEQCKFVIEKVEYEKDKVTVSGPFDANRLSCSLWAKAGRIIKNIEVIKEKKPERKPEPEPEPEPKPKPKCKLVYSCPYPCLQAGAWPCSCPTPHCGCHHQSKPPPPKPPAWSSSSSFYCGGCQPYMPPSSPPKTPHYCGGGGGGGYQYQPWPCTPAMPHHPARLCRTRCLSAKTTRRPAPSCNCKRNCATSA